MFVTGQSRAVKPLRVWVKNSSQRVCHALFDSSCLVRACVSDGDTGWLARLEAEGDRTAKGQGLAYKQASKCLQRGNMCPPSLSLYPSRLLALTAPCSSSSVRATHPQRGSILGCSGYFQACANKTLSSLGRLCKLCSRGKTGIVSWAENQAVQRLCHEMDITTCWRFAMWYPLGLESSTGDGSMTRSLCCIFCACCTFTSLILLLPIHKAQPCTCGCPNFVYCHNSMSMESKSDPSC